MHLKRELKVIDLDVESFFRHDTDASKKRIESNRSYLLRRSILQMHLKRELKGIDLRSSFTSLSIDASKKRIESRRDIQSR